MNRWGLEQREAEEIIAEVEQERIQATEPTGAGTPETEADVPPPDATQAGEADAA